jgi:phosphoserine phosphatase RsbU/P
MIDSENLKVKRNLTALVEFSRIINSSLNLNFILSNILLSCMGKFFATKGLIALKKDGQLFLASSKGIPEKLLNKFPVFKAEVNFLEEAVFKAYLKECSLVAVEKIYASDECVGIICLSEKLNKADYTEDDLEFLRTILNISATAIQNSLVLDELTHVNRRLDSRINRLNSLFELSKEFGLFSESTKVAKLLVYSIIGQFLVSRFAVITFVTGNIEVLESKIPEKDLLAALNIYRVNEISISLRKDELKKNYEELNNLKIELIVPMQLQGETKGLILLGKRINNIEFTDDDIEFIYSVGSLAIVSIENKRLFKEALEKQKMEEELEIARDIQRNLLPQFIPSYHNFEVAADNVSSKQVGGDYYDIITLDEDHFCVAIADVSGKGVPAALLMANIQAFLKVICKQGMNIDEATGLINDLLSENISDGKFITFFWGILDDKNKSINYVNAGHNPPLLVRDKKIIKLEKGGIILGVMKTMTPYLTEKISLKPGDVILLFTDGITEAMNSAGEEFSDETLEELSINLSDRSAAEILQTIKKEVQLFTAGATQSDDITIMVLKVK